MLLDVFRRRYGVNSKAPLTRGSSASAKITIRHRVRKRILDRAVSGFMRDPVLMGKWQSARRGDSR